MSETPKPTPPNRTRNYELAHGIYVNKNPDLMTPEERLTALEDVADFAARLLIEKIVLSKTISSAMIYADKKD